MDTHFHTNTSVRSFFKYITSESMGCGHPDKVADAISDAILDACLAQDPESRVGCETMVKGNQAVLAGEITTKSKLDYEQIVRDTVRSIGYRTAQDNPVFNSESLAVSNLICEQSPDIALGVDENKGEGKEQDAGDQGMMFGYACNETPELMPAPITFAHRIMRKLEGVRKSGACAWLRQDAKCQVTVEYDYEGKTSHISAVVLSTQHSESATREEIENLCLEVIKSSLPASLVSPATQLFSFKPADINEALGLKNPIFSATTNYGHFGKADLPWEKLDPKKLDKLKS